MLPTFKKLIFLPIICMLITSILSVVHADEGVQGSDTKPSIKEFNTSHENNIVSEINQRNIVHEISASGHDKTQYIHPQDPRQVLFEE